MQPTYLYSKAIARDATLRGDTKTLFHALDLLERVVPIATFMDFCHGPPRSSRYPAHYPPGQRLVGPGSRWWSRP